MEKIKIDNKTLEYDIVRSSRKSIGLEISPGKGLLIRAPKRVSRKRIEGVIKEKNPWIVKKLEEVKEVKPEPEPLKFVTGEKIPYLGNYYNLLINEVQGYKKPEIVLNNDYLSININNIMEKEERRKIIRDVLVSWYKNQARSVINKRIDIFKDRICVEPALVRIKKQKKRWGSCSSRGNLNFNWKLIMAPMSVLDYLVVHELAHLVYPNHSRDYWQLVESTLPDYQESKLWLKINGNLLTI